MYNYEEEKKKIGQSLGTSSWLLITQDMIDRFAQVTLDPDPLHIDPAWCREHSPFKQTTAFGFLTISLLTYLGRDVIKDDNDVDRYSLNYGFNRLRLVCPVPVNSRIRGHFKLMDLIQRRPGEYQRTIDVSIEVEGQSRPAVVAEWLSLLIMPEGHKRIATAS